MSSGAGKNLLLKIEDPNTPGTYHTLGGIRSKSLKINNEAIDITTQDSSEWKELLDTTGIRSMTVSGAGVFSSDAYVTQALTDMVAGTLRNFQVIDSVLNKTITCKFKIVTFEKAGEYNKEQTYSISMESSGAPTIA